MPADQRAPGSGITLKSSVTVEDVRTAISDMSFSLLPADYSQREPVSDVQRIRTEFVWKWPIRFSDKVLHLKVPTVDNIHNCQLGKLAVVTRYSFFYGNEGHRTSFIGSAIRSQDWLMPQIPGERIGKVA